MITNPTPLENARRIDFDQNHWAELSHYIDDRGIRRNFCNIVEMDETGFKTNFPVCLPIKVRDTDMLHDPELSVYTKEDIQPAFDSLKQYFKVKI